MALLAKICLCTPGGGDASGAASATGPSDGGKDVAAASGTAGGDGSGGTGCGSGNLPCTGLANCPTFADVGCAAATPSVSSPRAGCLRKV
ncbi:MAG: hypothetical protein LBD01_05000 [Puniceicoccales bacterium]|nr:hypothetical protein [Puniceicoccales bacterium]